MVANWLAGAPGLDSRSTEQKLLELLLLRTAASCCISGCSGRPGVPSSHCGFPGGSRSRAVRLPLAGWACAGPCGHPGVEGRTPRVLRAACRAMKILSIAILRANAAGGPAPIMLAAAFSLGDFGYFQKGGCDARCEGLRAAAHACPATARRAQGAGDADVHESHAGAAHAAIGTTNR